MPVVGRELEGVGKQVVGDLPDPEGIARHFAVRARGELQPQFQSFGGRRRGESRTDRLEELRRVEGHGIDLHFVGVEAVEVQQAVHQREQVLRRGFHVL